MEKSTLRQTTSSEKKMDQKEQCNNCALYLLLASVVGSLSVAGVSLLPLHPSDHIPIALGAWLSALGLVFFVSLFGLLNHVGLQTKVGQLCRKKYQLTIADVLDISNKIVSAVQAVLSCFTGVVVCAWSCTRNFLRSNHFLSEAYAWFGAAYFFYDIWSMYKVSVCTVVNGAINGSVGAEKQKSRFRNIADYFITQPLIILHHLFIGSFGFLLIVYLRGGLGDCVFGFVYLMELSTPFVSIRGILSKLKMKASSLYVVNGLTMLFTFFLCRLAMFPYVMYMYSEFINQSIWEAVKGLPTGCKVSMAILTIPQFYWFSLMTKGAVSIFSKKKVGSSSSSLKPSCSPLVSGADDARK